MLLKIDNEFCWHGFGSMLSKIVVFPLFCQSVSPAVLIRLLREHRSEWADFNIDAYSASALKASSFAYPGMRPMRFTGGNPIIMPLGHTIEHEEVCFQVTSILHSCSE